MNGRIFERPILVKNGQFVVEEIGSLADAFEFLNNGPTAGGDRFIKPRFVPVSAPMPVTCRFPWHATRSPGLPDRSKFSSPLPPRYPGWLGRNRAVAGYQHSR